MPGFNTIPGAAGGGGAGALNYVGAVYMSTYNRSWAQAGVAGNYAVYSQNQEQGYAYFVGTGITTGTSLNKMIPISHAFTRIDIVGVVGDVVSLYKTKVKSTTVYSGALQAFPFTTAATKSVQALTTSGTYTHPTAAGTLPLVNVIIAGGAGAAGGGHGAGHGGGGGGGGGNVVILNAIPVSATTTVEIGSAGAAAGSTQPGTSGGKTYFGNLYAIGGGGGGGWSSDKGLSGGNGGGGCAGHTTGTGGNGTVQTSSQGLDLSGTIGFFGGRPGGAGNPSTSASSRGGGGGGSTGDGTAGGGGTGGDGGQGHTTTFTGSSLLIGAGGYGISYSSGHGTDRRSGYTTTHACGGQGSNGSSGGQTATDNAQPGIILVGVYTL